MSMTKKDFVALAAAIKYDKPITNSMVVNAHSTVGDKVTSAVMDARMHQWEIMVRSITTFCRGQNGNFDRQRFEAACGLDE